MESIKWNLINDSNVKNKSGIYAWYYDVSLGKKDIELAILELAKAPDMDFKKEIIKSFLHKRIFSFFQESTYKATIEGQLMPTFSGELRHVEPVSQSIIDMIIDNPNILFELKESLELLSSEFLSPIYIGMAENLNVRVNTHKRLIEDFKNTAILGKSFNNRDECFAARVIARGMMETKLRVCICYLDSKNKIQKVIENILNRINYPILGRN